MMKNMVDSHKISSSKMQELSDLFNALEKEKDNDSLIQANILIDLIIETSKNLQPQIGKCNNLLNVKTRDIILREELINNLKIKNTDDIALLDVEEFTNLELTYEEQKELKTALKQTLKDKHDLLIKDFQDLSDNIRTINDVENLKRTTESQKEIIFKKRNELRKVWIDYINNLLNLADVLNKFLNLRNEAGVEAMSEKSEELYYQAQKNHLRSKILELKKQISIFKDSPMSLEAYQIAYKDLKEQQKNYMKQIEELRSDLEKYKVLCRSDEYQEILEDYKNYLKSIENYKWIQNEIFQK